jgi:hypothetical protein
VGNVLQIFIEHRQQDLGNVPDFRLDATSL